MEQIRFALAPQVQANLVESSQGAGEGHGVTAHTGGTRQRRKAGRLATGAPSRAVTRAPGRRALSRSASACSSAGSSLAVSSACSSAVGDPFPLANAELWEDRIEVNEHRHRLPAGWASAASAMDHADAALQKTQLLLDEFSRLDLIDERDPRILRSAFDPHAESEEREMERRASSASATETARPATVEVPVEMIQLLAELMAQFRDQEEQACKDAQPPVPGVVRADSGRQKTDGGSGSSSPSMSSTRVTSSPAGSYRVCSPSISFSSLGCSVESSIEPRSRAEQIEDLREMFISNLPPQAVMPPRACRLFPDRKAQSGAVRLTSSPSRRNVGVPRRPAAVMKW